MYHAGKWHNDERFLAPMMIHPLTGEHIYTGDLVALQLQDSIGKVTKLFTVSEVQLY